MPELKSKFMAAVDRTAPGKATRRWDILSRSSGGPLGWIAWYGAWRQYVFYPAPDTLYNNGCLESIQAFLTDANMEQKAR